LVLPATYLDSNVISYLTARPSRDIVSLAHQELTHEWWNRQRHNFDLHISELVMFEIGRGDPIAAASRRMLVRDLPVLQITSEARTLADQIFSATTLPDKAAPDASTRCVGRDQRNGFSANLELYSHRERSCSENRKRDLS